MKGDRGYAVFFFPQAIEALGDAIKPYLQEGPAGLHIACQEIDTAGGFVEMTMRGKTEDGKDVTLELLVPSGMVRMIVSSQQGGSFGFRPREPEVPGPSAQAARSDPATTPAAGEAASAD